MEVPEQSIPDFQAVATRVFKEVNGKIFIGSEEIKGDMRTTLREQARYVQTSQLWELMGNAIVNESANLALLQSTEWNHILTAKQLHHWGHVFRNMIHALAKE